MAAKKIVTNFFKQWYTTIFEGGVRIAVHGNCWIDGVNKTGQALAKTFFERFSSTKDLSNFADTIPYTGNFCIVLESQKLCFAVTDRIRSIPLFYGYRDSQLFLSDNARWVRAKLNDNVADPAAIIEFRYAGFVTGPNTLYPKVKQLQAGQWLIAARDVNSEIKCHKYYKYTGSDPYPLNKEVLTSNLDKVFLNAFSRMIQAADGRTIVIPLSAGLDSRLVITMLKRLDYKNIIAFSYGKKGNSESQKSREISEQIGCQWLFVPYTRRLWRKVYRSDLFKSYMDFASGLSMIPHIQDWIAVKHFKEKQLIPEDAVFVPGHTGDFIAGGHIPSYYSNIESVDKNEVIRYIRNKHYRLWNLKKAPRAINDIITNKIESRLKNIKVENPETAASAIEFFDWQERQPKHVVNSVRIYEYWGYDWFLPLWDTEVMDFWQKVPLEYKIGKRLYKEYLHDKNFYGVFSSVTVDTGNLQKLGVKKYSMVEKISDKYHKSREKYLVPLRKRYLDYYLNQYQWHGIYSYFQVAFKYGFHQNIYSLLSDSYLLELSNNHNI